ncbi:MAG: peptide/nickel transport system substrate-binding protein [Rhodospirillaceae bacterium]|nr:peptide/nickel transport system substrate-binding protein [Rhodospirillaceae bacterium]
MTKENRIIDSLRRGRSDIENDLIDQFSAGHISRRELMRHGSLFGMSLPLLAGLAAAFGAGFTARPARAAGSGGTLRIAQIVPAGAIDPITVADGGGLIMLQQTGEFLTFSGQDLVLKPMLAESWKPNQDGTVWTFKLRQGVKFHNGKTMTADDVVATIDRLADPKNASNALSAFSGVLSKGGTRKIDDHTVEFHLDAPNGNFPYYVSSDNYNTIILPADYPGGFEKNFIGTGPFKLDKYTPKAGASFLRNPDYWGPKALLERTEFSFYADMQSQVLALQGHQVDVIYQVPVHGGQALLNDPDINISSLKSSAHQQVHMRTDMEPFKDKRVRRAMALCLNRAKLTQGLFRGRADIGNDSPFAPVFPSTDRLVPQREQNIREAKQLMEAAGLPNGFEVTLTTEKYLEIPDYAILIQNAVKAIGVKVKLNIESQDAYYGKATFGNSDWLDSPLGITDYGHRGVPNVLLAAPLKSDGTWNAAHFKNPEYDRLVAQYVAALDLQSQRSVAGHIQKLLLDETPVIFGYFYDYLTPTRKNVNGVMPTANGQLFLGRASIA